MRLPAPRVTIGGSPPTERNERTGEFTPPGMTSAARSRHCLDLVSSCMAGVYPWRTYPPARRPHPQAGTRSTRRRFHLTPPAPFPGEERGAHCTRLISRVRPRREARVIVAAASSRQEGGGRAWKCAGEIGARRK